MSESQWLFSVDALDFTPSTCSREREFYDRARGVEFLFRLGANLALLVLSTLLNLEDLTLSPRPTSAMCTAATWFHRFFMRCSMQDFHRQVYLPPPSFGLLLTVVVSTLLLLVSSWRRKLKSAAESYKMLQECLMPKLRIGTLKRFLGKVR